MISDKIRPHHLERKALLYVPTIIQRALPLLVTVEIIDNFWRLPGA
jgi:hypothetical protein